MKLEFIEELVELVWWNDIQLKIQEIFKKDNLTVISKKNYHFSYPMIIVLSKCGKIQLTWEPMYFNDEEEELPPMYWKCIAYKIDAFLDSKTNEMVLERTMAWQINNMPKKTRNNFPVQENQFPPTIDNLEFMDDLPF